MNYTLIKKMINACLLISSLFGYLEWGIDHHSFIFQIEAELFLKAHNDASGFVHPLILIPLCGQMFLIYTLFQTTPSRILSLMGLICLSIFLLFLLFIGLLESNIKIIVSTLPFIISGIFVIKYNRKQKIDITQ